MQLRASLWVYTALLVPRKHVSASCLAPARPGHLRAYCLMHSAVPAGGGNA